MYKTTTDFCALVVRPETLLNSLKSSSSSLVASLGISMYSYHIICRAVALLYCLFHLDSFHFFGFLWLRCQKLCWLEMVRVRILVLFPDLRNASWTSLCWGYIPLCPLSGVFNHKWMLYFILKNHSSSTEMVIFFFAHMVFILQFINSSVSHWLIY